MVTLEEQPIKYCWQIIKERIWIFLAIFFLTVAATALGSYLWTPTYEATSTILLDYVNPNPLDMQMNMANSNQSMEYMLTEKNIIESKSVALRVIEGLKLEESPAVRAAYENSRPSALSKQIFPWKRDKDIKTWLVDFLSQYLRVEPQKDSRILAITYSSPDPNFSATVANAYAWAYNTYHLELKVTPLKESVEWISQKVNELKKDVEAKEKGLEEFKAEKGVVNPNENHNIAMQKLNQLNADLAAAEVNVYETSAKMKLIKDMEKSKSGFEAIQEIIANSLIQNLKVEKVRLEKELSDLSKRVGENHPQYVRLTAELQTVNEKTNIEIKNIISAIQSEYKTAISRRDTLRTALEDQKKEVLAVNKETSDVNVLTLEADTSRRVYDALLTKFSDATLRGDINRTNVIIVDKAIPPSAPSKPDILLNMALSIVCGLFLGIAAVFFLNALDNTIKSEDDIRTDFGLAVLGIIPEGGKQ